MVDSRLRELIDRSLQELFEFKKEVVRSSMPILFFGNLERYNKSKRRKVVTVGLNPSRDEFPEGKRFSRFPAMRGWSPDTFDHNDYIKSLSCYFDGDYYQTYFDDFEDVIQVFCASYHCGNLYDRALHTDFCSPLATRKLWGELYNAEQQGFKKKGVRLWMDLIDYLEPDLIFSTIAFKKHIAPKITGRWRKRAVKIDTQEYNVYWVQTNFCAKHSLMVNVEHTIHEKLLMRHVLGNLSPSQRKQLGKSIYRMVMR
jgi:hypothetical protein